jgi:DNA polymerase-3 subunit delta'
VTGLKDLIGQQRPVKLLVNALGKNRIPHALLFTGEKGVGRKTAALELARICNCRDLNAQNSDCSRRSGAIIPRPCGQCRSCKKAAAGAHPAIRTITPSGINIRIDQIRAICGELGLKSDENSRRFIIVDDAHRMNAEASNALLKILEEPPEHTIFVLVAPDTSDLLPTIVSRCQHIRFNPITPGDLEYYLTEKCEKNRQQAMIIASLAGGSLGRALDMTGEDWIAKRNFIIDQLRGLSRQPRGFRYVLAEILAKDKDRFEGIIEIIKNWYRDMAVIECAPEQVYNQDIADQVLAGKSEITMDAILKISDAAAAAQKALKSNANIRLIADRLMEIIAVSTA